MKLIYLFFSKEFLFFLKKSLLKVALLCIKKLGTLVDIFFYIEKLSGPSKNCQECNLKVIVNYFNLFR